MEDRKPSARHGNLFRSARCAEERDRRRNGRAEKLSDSHAFATGYCHSARAFLVDAGSCAGDFGIGAGGYTARAGLGDCAQKARRGTNRPASQK